MWLSQKSIVVYQAYSMLHKRGFSFETMPLLEGYLFLRRVYSFKPRLTEKHLTHVRSVVRLLF